MFESCGLTPGTRLAVNNPKFRRLVGADASPDTMDRELDRAFEYVPSLRPVKGIVYSR